MRKKLKTVTVDCTKTDSVGILNTEKEMMDLLKEARDLLVLCTLIDKSGQCKILVDKIDAKTGWK